VLKFLYSKIFFDAIVPVKFIATFFTKILSQQLSEDSTNQDFEHNECQKLIDN